MTLRSWEIVRIWAGSPQQHSWWSPCRVRKTESR